jgi:hypothetical protein
MVVSVVLMLQSLLFLPLLRILMITPTIPEGCQKMALRARIFTPKTMTEIRSSSVIKTVKELRPPFHQTPKYWSSWTEKLRESFRLRGMPFSFSLQLLNSPCSHRGPAHPLRLPVICDRSKFERLIPEIRSARVVFCWTVHMRIVS